MSLNLVSATQAHQLLADNRAVLVDVRAADEHAREHIAGALSLPMDKLHADALPVVSGQQLIFHCRSGNRTRLAADRLAACAGGNGLVLEGGLDGWLRAGLPVLKDARAPMELSRQVQLGAGGMALAGFVLGATVSPWFHLLSGLVGGGLMLAGATGFCGLARVLMHAPWNRVARA